MNMHCFVEAPHPENQAMLTFLAMLSKRREVDFQMG
jgi:hypothetical protein